MYIIEYAHYIPSSWFFVFSRGSLFGAWWIVDLQLWKIGNSRWSTIKAARHFSLCCDDHTMWSMLFDRRFVTSRGGINRVHTISFGIWIDSGWFLIFLWCYGIRNRINMNFCEKIFLHTFRIYKLENYWNKKETQCWLIINIEIA